MILGRKIVLVISLAMIMMGIFVMGVHGEDLTVNFSQYDEGTILENWEYQNTNETCAVVSVNKTLSITAKEKEEFPYYDPIFIYSLLEPIPAQNYNTVKIGLRWSNVSGGVTPEIYFLTNKHTDWSDGAYYQNSAPNTSNSSSGTVEFSFNMAEKAGWAGDVTSIRIDPANKAGSYELEYITFVDNGNQIIYDANGGTGAPVNATHLEDGIYALSTTQPIRDGFEFKGWSLEENGTEKDVVTTVTIAGESVVVYAVWSQVSYTQSSLGFASEFDVDGDFGEWSLSGNGFSLKEVEDGILKLETTVQDARMSKDFSDTGSLSSQYCILKNQI